MPDNNLILGLAAGYHYGDVRPFLVSLERTGCRARVVLFVSETTRDLDRMARHGVTIVPVERSPHLDGLPYNALRYFLYRDYLAGATTRFHRILLTDVRDVIFQRDPFSFAWPAGLNCVLEDRGATVVGCQHNAHWVRAHQGEGALARIADRPISCSGTTVGDHAGVTGYLAELTTRLLPYEGGERMAGYDQGVHNTLVHTGGLTDLTLHDNRGPVLTLGQTKGEPETDGDGYVLNEAGERAHMVHQYDRKPMLFQTIRERYDR